MLARDYSQYEYDYEAAPSLAPQQDQEAAEIAHKIAQMQLQHEQERKRKAELAATRLQANTKYFILSFCLALCSYLAAVHLDAVATAQGQHIVALTKNKEGILNTNKELNIKIEELKAPDRVISFARSRGMDSAKRNIYMYINQGKTSAQPLNK